MRTTRFQYVLIIVLLLFGATIMSACDSPAQVYLPQKEEQEYLVTIHDTSDDPDIVMQGEYGVITAPKVQVDAQERAQETRVEAPVREYVIDGYLQYFSPRSLYIRLGQTVKLTLRADREPQDLSIPALGVYIVSRPYESNSQTVRLDKRGRFDIVCDRFCPTGQEKKATLFVDEIYT